MSAQRQRQQPWRSAGRHHCAICNAWMGSDRQSILLHENGRGHREATERAAEARREEKREAERREGSMRDTMGRIEEEARRAMAMDAEAGKLYGGRASVPFLCPPAPPVPAPVPPPPPPPKPKAAGTARPPPGEGGGGGGGGGDRSSWQDRRAKRLRTDDGDAAAADAAPAGSARFGRHRLPPPGEGHYTLEGGGGAGGIYLEARVYWLLLEAEVPVQIWTGDGGRLPDRRGADWKTGIVVRVRRGAELRPSPPSRPSGRGGFIDVGISGGESDLSSSEVAVDVAYLRPPGQEGDDDQEVVERSVALDRLRLLLGSDPMLPGTVEEARLELLGGEELVEVGADGGAGTSGTGAEIDENTGLPKFQAVSVRRVTANRAVREERSREALRRKEDEGRAAERRREAEGRRMEEAKVADADDSALGSYDVWNGGRAGYRGVDILSVEAKMDVADTARSLAGEGGQTGAKKAGASSMFKKKKKKAGKKQNRRVTSADDD